ncbi:hypothetical protein BD560DRAFT_449574 [Blakeslea trispora]|nr:hypothetical protein BD560DRAFT_449574 [Blakeslea trispora]
MNNQKHNVQQVQQQAQLQLQQHQNQMQQSQMPQQPQSRRRPNSNKSNRPAVTRKRSHSSSSSSPDSASPNLFSNASSSDSASSSMTLSKEPLKKKRTSGSSMDSSVDPPSTDSSRSQAQSSSASSIKSASNLSSLPSSGGSVLTAQRSVPAFLNKLYNMVEDSTTNDLIRWSKDGTSFIVEKHEEFAKNVLPRFYKHNTFASFVRQLNMYDFHKVPHLQQGVMIAENEYEIWEFSNPHFQRGRPDLLVLVTRKRNRDKDIVDTENVTLSSLVQDLSAIKKQQTSIGTDLREMHRDNEILWQETLNARDKYQRHQDAIEKILQFLTAIFANDHLAISMNNGDSLPKGLIEEAASLAGMPAKIDAKSNTPLSSSLASSALSNIFSSAMRLYSSSSDMSQPDMNQRHPSNMPDSDKSSFDATQLSYTPSPQEAELEEEKGPSVVEFSRTLNTATRSAQNITQDIDMLQANIESLANGLGIDPSRFDEETDHSLHSGYNPMFSTTDDTKLLSLPEGNPEFYEPYKRKESNVVPQYTFDMQSRQYQHIPDANNDSMPLHNRPYTLQAPAQLMTAPPIQRAPLQQPQPQQRMQPQQGQRLYNIPCLPEEKSLQPEVNSTENSYRQFLNSMNYSEAYYPMNQDPSSFQQQRNSFEVSNSPSTNNNMPTNRRQSSRMTTFYGSTSDEDIITSSMQNNQDGFQPTLVNHYPNTMRPRYFNTMHTTNENEENFNDNT